MTKEIAIKLWYDFLDCPDRYIRNFRGNSFIGDTYSVTIGPIDISIGRHEGIHIVNNRDSVEKFLLTDTEYSDMVEKWRNPKKKEPISLDEILNLTK